MEEQKIGKIYEALAKVNEELVPIAKDQQGFGYKFRGINQVFNTLNPLFKKYKVVTKRENLESERIIREVPEKKKTYVEVFLKCDYVFVSLEDGSEFRTQGFGEGQDSSGGDKASSMATSNSYKYVIFELFNIAVEEQKDSDQVTSEAADDSKFTKSDAKKRGNAYRKSAPKKEEEEKGEEDDI